MIILWKSDDDNAMTCSISVQRVYLLLNFLVYFKRGIRCCFLWRLFLHAHIVMFLKNENISLLNKQVLFFTERTNLNWSKRWAVLHQFISNTMSTKEIKKQLAFYEPWSFKYFAVCLFVMIFQHSYLMCILRLRGNNKYH